MTTTTPKVWIGCLAAYNAGCLHGEWVDATDADELEEAKDRILASSPEPMAEEWFIADTDGFGHGLVGEYSPFEEVAKIGAAIEEHDGAFLAYAEVCDDVDTAIDTFEEAYRGQWDSEQAYIYQYVDDICLFDGIPDDHPAVTYFDWEYYTREQFRHGDLTAVRSGAPDYGVYVFDESVR